MGLTLHGRANCTLEGLQSDKLLKCQLLGLSLLDLLELVLEQGILLDLLVEQQANLVNLQKLDKALAYLLLEALVFVVDFGEVLAQIANLHLLLLPAFLGGLAVLEKSACKLLLFESPTFSPFADCFPRRCSRSRPGASRSRCPVRGSNLNCRYLKWART